MLVDLAVERVWQGLLPEAGQKGHPVVKFKSMLLVSKVLVEGGDDLNERAHNVREEGDTTQEDEYAQDHLLIRLWRQVTITDC